MRYAIVIASAAGLALLGGAANGAGDARGKATVKLVRGAPLTVRGTHFVPGERIRLTVSGERHTTRRLTASGTGAFVAQFAFAYDRCRGLIVLAVGSQGSRAGLKRPELMCRPPL